MTTMHAAEPVAGPLFRAALRTPLRNGDHLRERRMLLALIAAHIDTGHQPAVRQLAERLGVPGNRYRQVRRVDDLLAALEADGVLVVRRADGERNRYEIKLAEVRS
jgi:hypothetical protein